MYILSSLFFLIIITAFSPVTADSDISSQDPSVQLAPDELDVDKTDPRIDTSLQQPSQYGVVALDQDSFGSVDEETSWLALTPQNDPSVSIPTDAIAQDTAGSNQPCDSTKSKREVPGIIPAASCINPVAHKKVPKKPKCPDGSQPFCCARQNSEGKVFHCFRWGLQWGDFPAACDTAQGGIVRCCEALSYNDEGVQCVDPVAS